MPDPVGTAGSILASLARHDVPLGPLTTYRVGGNAALFLEARHVADLVEARGAVIETGVRVIVVGRGSNLLVADAGFGGLAVMLGESFAWADVGAGWVMRAGGAASLPVVARKSAAAGLTGFEWAVGVPGSIGGAVRMNAGGHGSDIATVIGRWWSVDLAGGEDGEAEPEVLALGYRRSSVRPEQVVTAAELRLLPGDRHQCEAEISAIVRWRREHQPGGQNAGSVFTNPPGDSAGRLVDAAGLKGFRVGSACVSTKHANFFQADVGGSADDVRALIEEVRRRVHDHSGVLLEPELRLVGFEEEE